MRQPTTLVLLFLATFSVALVRNADQAFGQNSGLERVFHSQKTDVENAIQSLHAALNGRLPIFDGFVEKAGELSDQYSRGYFELAVQTVAEGKETTRVRVTGKITAWYTDPTPAQSGYRVLSSNGRLEADLLDRIEEALAPKGQAANTPNAARPENSSPAMSSSATEWSAIDRVTRFRNGLGSGNPNPLPSQPAGIAAPPATPEDIEALRRQREEA